MEKLKKWVYPFCFGLLSISLCVSCDDDDNDETDYDEGKAYVDNQPTTDEVNTSFNGKVALLQQNSDQVMNYLSRRLVNTTTELTDSTDVVVLDEAKAQEILGGGTEYETLQNLWNSNKILVFLNPGSRAFVMVNKLSQPDSESDVDEPTSADLLQFENVKVYATRADGTSLFHERMDVSKNIIQTCYRDSIANSGTLFAASMQSDSLNVAAFTNDYNQGRIAENLATWLNENALTGEQPHVALVSSSSTYSVSPVSVTKHYSLTVSHDWFKKHSSSKATVPNPTTVDVKFQMDIYGTYSTETNKDVYDINLYEEFPAEKTYIKDVYVYEHLAYNYKYTGGCYYGPKVDLSLNSISTSDIEVEAVAPLPQTDGQYNMTHYPMQLGFGASLQGNVSTEPGISAGLSMSCTLPYTTVSFNHAEMPISFNNDNKHANWSYSTDYRVYSCQWGFNPKFKDLPDVVHSFCKTDQAVTFVVKNTQSYGSKTVSLHSGITWQVYDEYADPWEHWHNVSSYYRGFTTNLPKVNRYFEKYTPYPMPGFSGAGDSDEWGNLEDRLMRNVNYRALCDETLQVGSQTANGLDQVAESIWRTAINSIVKQYNGTNTNHEYVVALARTNGSHIKLGLHIKNGVWTLVENVDNVAK